MSLHQTARALAFRALGEARFEDLRASYVARKIRSGRYRPDEIDLLPQLVGPGESVIDVGANLGVYTYNLAVLTGETGRVYAFEAVPETCRALRRVLPTLGVAERVEVIEKAAGDRVGSIPFSIPRRADGSVLSGRAAALPDEAPPSGITLPMTMIDDEIPSDVEISFMKVDIEGAEIFALSGAERVIAASQPTLLLEIAPALLRRHGMSGADVQAFLHERGYETYSYDGARNCLGLAAAGEFSGDLLAVHPSRAARLEPRLEIGAGEG